MLAEENLLIREGVLRLLDAEVRIERAAACGDPDALLAAVEAERPDVVITDIRTPTGTDEGIRAAEQLRLTHPEIGVMALSQHDDAEYALALLESGSASRAYMHKERVWQSQQLIAAICEVAHGGSVMDQKVVESLLVLKRRGAHSPLVNLTQREREVLAQEPHADRRVRAVLVFLAHQA